MSFVRDASHVAGLLSAALGLLSGCVSLTALSSGHVGCPENEIEITEDQGTTFTAWTTRTWTAECKGRKFYCTAHGGSQYSTAQVSCKEEQAKPENAGQAAAPPTASGCQYDAQCKGDRICQKGQCVDAEKASSARNTCRRGDSADCQAKCEGGSSASCFNLGKMYEEGDGVPVDIERMAQYFDMACKQGDMAACTNLGNKFERGLGVQADPSRAVPLYLRACGLGSSYGCAALAALYENGKGVAQDRVRASELYGKACKAGNAAGCEGAKRTAP